MGREKMNEGLRKSRKMKGEIGAPLLRGDFHHLETI